MVCGYVVFGVPNLIAAGWLVHGVRVPGRQAFRLCIHLPTPGVNKSQGVGSGAFKPQARRLQAAQTQAAV